jgi:predicted nucleotidyltransferase
LAKSYGEFVRKEETTMPVDLQVAIPSEQLAEFCRRWQVTELALFGSVLRPDFNEASDVDVLVTFAPEARPTLFDLAEMQDELAGLFGRPVDLLTKRGVQQSHNPLRRKAILESAQVVYAT